MLPLLLNHQFRTQKHLLPLPVYLDVILKFLQFESECIKTDRCRSTDNTNTDVVNWTPLFMYTGRPTQEFPQQISYY